MANIAKVNFDIIKKWEGGLSKDPKDPAAKNPVPDGSGFHTNMGITWDTFSALAPKLKYEATADNFIKMPPEIWLKIYKNGFWDGVKADNYNSQAIAELMADWAWASGPGFASQKLQEFINLYRKPGVEPIKVDGLIGSGTIQALHELIHRKGERIVFEDLDRFRRDFLKTIKIDVFRKFGLGWYNRMDDFRNYAVGIIP